MKIIAVSQLKIFWQKHPGSEQSFLCWIDEAKKANWQTPADIKGSFAMPAFSRATGSCSTSKVTPIGSW